MVGAAVSASPPLRRPVPRLTDDAARAQLFVSHCNHRVVLWNPRSISSWPAADVDIDSGALGLTPPETCVCLRSARRHIHILQSKIVRAYPRAQGCIQG